MVIAAKVCSVQFERGVGVVVCLDQGQVVQGKARCCPSRRTAPKRYVRWQRATRVGQGVRSSWSAARASGESGNGDRATVWALSSLVGVLEVAAILGGGGDESSAEGPVRRLHRTEAAGRRD
jgi:hypothetical protein